MSISETGEIIKLFPIQANPRNREAARVRESIYLRAYEVYSEVYGPQEALLVGYCRGGFGVGELVAFLYAHSFPRSEWRARTEEAFQGMNLD